MLTRATFFTFLFILLLLYSNTFSQANQWLTLKQGQKKSNFHFDKNGVLSYKSKPFNQKILVQKKFGKQLHESPDSITISPKSPNGTYVFLHVDLSESRDCWLLDLEKKKIFNANETHYGPSKWVEWSPDDRYAILHDGESGLLQRMDLKTKKIIDLPVAERQWLRGGIENISEENTYEVLSPQDRFGDVNVGSFFWLTGTSMFRVEVDIIDYGLGKLRSYVVEVDVQSGSVREIH